MPEARPIVFDNESVKAILKDQKTQFRKVVKPYPYEAYEFDRFDVPVLRKTFALFNCCVKYNGTFHDWIESVPLPYLVGDVFYIREAWGHGYYEGEYIYKASDKLADHPNFASSTKMIYNSPVTMPKEAARLIIEIRNVRVERLQDITTDEIRAEGICGESEMNLAHEFRKKWDSKIKKSEFDTYCADANPWVFVYEFELIHKRRKCNGTM